MGNLYFDDRDWTGKELILICVPYGGGWSTIYNIWEQYLDQRIALLPVKFPGRGGRMDEQSHPDMQTLIKDITPVIASYELPMVFYGGCFGGLCAYEMIKELQTTCPKRAMHLFTNSLVSPRYIKEELCLSQWPKEELTRELFKRRELPQEVLEDEEVLDFLLPGIRADYQIYEAYKYQESGKIDINLSIFYNDETDIQSEENWDWINLIKGKCQRILIEKANLFTVESQIAIGKQTNSKLVQMYL